MPSGIYKHKKGYKLSKEHREKISLSHLGVVHSSEIIEKISKSLTGKKRAPFSLEWRNKMSERQKGSKSPRWKGGITLEHYKIRNSMEYGLWRSGIFAKDFFTCQKCGNNSGGKLRAHHILNFAQWPDRRLDLNNGITFCVDCHKLFHHLFGRQNNTFEQLEEFLKNAQYKTIIKIAAQELLDT